MSELSLRPQYSPNVNDSSPLGTLIRRTSSRRAPNHRPSNLDLPTPPRPSAGPSSAPPAPPHSPILHTQFRSSTATTSSYYDDSSMRTFSWDGRSAADTTVPSSPSSTRTYRGPHAQAHYGQDHHGQDHDQEHGAPHASMLSESNYDIDDITARYRDTWRSSGVDPRATYAPQDPEEIPAVPTVVVSAEPEHQQHQRQLGYGAPSPSKGGRVPSRVASGPGNVNFSRPGLPPDVDERKREVLLRNAHARSPGSSPATSPRLGPSSPSVHGGGSRPVSPASLAERQQPSSFQSPFPPHSPSPSPSPAQTPITSGLGPRVPSQLSLYSNYSYYELPGTPPANRSQPSSPGLPPSSAPASASQASLGSPSGRQRSKSQNKGKGGAAAAANLVNPQTPQDYLQVGIQHHLENRLEESAAAFEKAATLNGGCGVGMLMWGLAQRHGWGCTKSEVAGFRWLRRAAELAVIDLEKGKQGMDMGAVKSELVLAIYEVGQSFYRGWGVEKDKEMAVQYFRVAARLGDPDAQQELAFCLLNGKGCKKDKRESAKWYRAAVAQGASDIGLAWIYKDKYQ